MLNDANNLVSPVTGGKMTLKWNLEEVEFRKEKIKVWYPFYECEDTGNHFTTTESDNIWCRQMRHQYCQRYGIPYTDEIISLRESYNLSAQKMSLLLGFGENQWRKYEQGEIPNVSNGRLIRTAMNPRMMLDLVESARKLLTDREYRTIREKVSTTLATPEDLFIKEYSTRRLFPMKRGMENGFAPLSLDRLKNVLLLVLEKCAQPANEMWIAKMNKMLFFIDFLSYRERGIAITGLSYRAIAHGPVPERWERVYSEFDEIGQESREARDFEGQVLVANAKADTSALDSEELQIIDYVCNKLKGYSTRELSEIAHREKAWKNHQTDQEIIPFSDAFSLESLDYLLTLG